MKEIYIINESEELEYVSTISEDEITLRHSHSEIWTSHTQGTDIGKLKDTGNEIMIAMNEGVDLKLDYDAFCNLYRLMDLKIKTSENLTDTIKYVDESNIEI